MVYKGSGKMTGMVCLNCGDRFDVGSDRTPQCPGCNSSFIVPEAQFNNIVNETLKGNPLPYEVPEALINVFMELGVKGKPIRTMFLLKEVLKKVRHIKAQMKKMLRE